MEINLTDLVKWAWMLKSWGFSIDWKNISQASQFLKNQKIQISDENKQKILDFLKSPSARDFQNIRQATKRMPFIVLAILILGWIVYLINNKIWNAVLILGLISFIGYYFFSTHKASNGKNINDIKNQVLSDISNIFLAKKINFSPDQKFFKYNLENIVSGIINTEKINKLGSWEVENICFQKFFTQKLVTHTSTDPKTKETKTISTYEKGKDYLLVSISKPWEYTYLTNPVNIFRNKNFLEKMFQTDQVKLEDIRFENIFDVTGDQITSRQVLNQDFMEKLTAVSKNPRIVGFQFSNWLANILYDMTWKDFMNISTFIWENFLVNQIYENIETIKNIFDDKEILKL